MPPGPHPARGHCRRDTRLSRRYSLKLSPIPKAEYLPFVNEFIKASCVCVKLSPCWQPPTVTVFHWQWRHGLRCRRAAAADSEMNIAGSPARPTGPASAGESWTPGRVRLSRWHRNRDGLYRPTLSGASRPRRSRSWAGARGFRVQMRHPGPGPTPRRRRPARRHSARPEAGPPGPLRRQSVTVTRDSGLTVTALVNVSHGSVTASEARPGARPGGGGSPGAGGRRLSLRLTARLAT